MPIPIPHAEVDMNVLVSLLESPMVRPPGTAHCLAALSAICHCKCNRCAAAIEEVSALLTKIQGGRPVDPVARLLLASSLTPEEYNYLFAAHLGPYPT